jgi:hypothetical protein
VLGFICPDLACPGPNERAKRIGALTSSTDTCFGPRKKCLNFVASGKIQ